MGGTYLIYSNITSKDTLSPYLQIFIKTNAHNNHWNFIKYKQILSCFTFDLNEPNPNYAFFFRNSNFIFLYVDYNKVELLLFGYFLSSHWSA